MEQMGFPDGVYDFKALVTGGYYFVDKTGLICDLCGTKNKTIFITRPRRFGKTLNLSMIDRFFNIDYADEEDIFNGLAVSGCERCARYKNAYPVLRLDFGYLSGESVDSFLDSMNMMISVTAQSLKISIGIEAFEDDEKRFLQECIDMSLKGAKLWGAAVKLCGMLKRIYGKDVIILVDEYDHCMQSIHSEELFESIVGFLRPFMEQTFKLNRDCEFAVVTGIMPLAKTSMLSSFNNATVCSILETDGDEYFGFTEEEIVRLIEETGNPPDKLSEIKEWYDGYRFGDADVYNPYSVIMYLKNNCEPLAYWNNMTGGGMSKDLLSIMGAEALTALRGLYENKGSSFETVLDTRISYSDILSPTVKPSVVYSYLAMAGYLKAERTGAQEDGFPVCRISMVNNEVSIAFMSLVERSAEVDRRASAVMDSIYSGNDSMLEDFLESMLNGLCLDVSWSRLDPVSRHNRYRDVIMAYLKTPELSARAEMPKGYGFADIFFAKDGDRPAVIIEVKTTDDPQMDLSVLAEKALAQIEGRGMPRIPIPSERSASGWGSGRNRSKWLSGRYESSTIERSTGIRVLRERETGCQKYSRIIEGAEISPSVAD